MRIFDSVTGRHCFFRSGQHSSNLVTRSTLSERSCARSASGSSWRKLLMFCSLYSRLAIDSSTRSAGIGVPRQLIESSMALCTTEPRASGTDQPGNSRSARNFFSQPCTEVIACLFAQIETPSPRRFTWSATPRSSSPRSSPRSSAGNSGHDSRRAPIWATTSCCTGLSSSIQERARSRRRYFWILPVEVFGSSPNSTALGVLNPAKCSRQNATISSAVAS